MRYIKRENNTNKLNNIYGLSDRFFNILLNRGIDTDLKVRNFLQPSLDLLHSPLYFNNMKNVADKIKTAFSLNRNIVLIGKNNTDSAMSISMLYLSFRNITKNVYYRIFDENKLVLTDNYLKNLGDEGSLFILIDCSITNTNLDVIIIDHHICNCINNGYVLNPLLDGENYPFKNLCSAGIVAKLLTYLFGLDYIKKYLDLITIATISDDVLLIDENRNFVYKGLEFINTIRRPGLNSIYLYTQNNLIIESRDLKSQYCNLFDYYCKEEKTEDIIELMTTNDFNIIQGITEKVISCVSKSLISEKVIYDEVKKEIKKTDKCFVLYNKNWNLASIKNVIGNISKKYGTLTILLKEDEITGKCYGYIKGNEIINIYKILYNSCFDTNKVNIKIRANFAKVEIKKDYIEIFKDIVIKECDKLDSNFFDNIIYYDDVFKMQDISKKLYKELRLLQPCGFGNPEVKILFENVSMKEIIPRGKFQQHFAAKLFDETSICDSICYNHKIPKEHDYLNVVCSITSQKVRKKEKLVLTIDSFYHRNDYLQTKLASSETQYGVRVIDQDIEILGLPETKCTQLRNAGINTVRELVNYFPTRYWDYRNVKMANDISTSSEVCSMIGNVYKLKKGDKCCYAMCIDDEGNRFMVTWFGQSYVLRQLFINHRYIFCGEAKRNETGLVQMYPKESMFSMDIDKLRAIIPEYKKVKGMAQGYLLDVINKALSLTANTDFLDKNIVEDFNMLSDYDATMKLHRPKNDFEIRDGQKRKMFNDLFRFNFILKSQNKQNETSKYLLKNRNRLNDMEKLLPYALTNDQRKTIDNIYEYCNSGKILNSLVQGDVGCGKTTVAIFAMLMAVNNGYQACVIAPTEVLASQHYQEVSDYMNKLGYKVGYLVGSLKAKEKREVLKGLEDGSINIVVGTHAVIQDTVVFNDLAMVVVDEQHRFGVEQREKLTQLGAHMVAMSATPIPRTLSMALYGDNIQVYNIKEKPAGRKEIITLRKDSDEEINLFMLDQIRQGRQCYVVCPLIEDSESESISDVHSVKSVVEDLIKFFEKYPEVKISNTTGRMKKELIEEEIGKFVRNESNILVSTTIIEVGVNVPNSTVMVLKSSERFGLAQAHQLRGRVGRGSYQSYCLLQTDKDDPKAEILCNSNDGFEISKQDLLLRGPGDYIGTQQTGSNKNVFLMMTQPELYQKISDLNDKIYADNSLFAKYKYLLED